MTVIWNRLLKMPSTRNCRKCLFQGHNNITGAGFEFEACRSKVTRVTAGPCCRRFFILSANIVYSFFTFVSVVLNIKINCLLTFLEKCYDLCCLRENFIICGCGYFLCWCNDNKKKQRKKPA